MATARRYPHPALVAGLALWLGAVILAPLAAAGGWRVAPWLYAAFHLVCHQIPERSFFLGEHALAVCHRCAGLYAGGLLGLLALPWLPALRRWLAARPKRLLWLVLPMLIDVALPWNTWWSRFATGALAAVPVAWVLWQAADQILASRPWRAGAAAPIALPSPATPASARSPTSARSTTGRLEVAEWKGNR